MIICYSSNWKLLKYISSFYLNITLNLPCYIKLGKLFPLRPLNSAIGNLPWLSSEVHHSQGGQQTQGQASLLIIRSWFSHLEPWALPLIKFSLWWLHPCPSLWSLCCLRHILEGTKTLNYQQIISWHNFYPFFLRRSSPFLLVTSWTLWHVSVGQSLCPT